jgi:nucleoside-specific outer membrane channel protein Tsx
VRSCQFQAIQSSPEVGQLDHLTLPDYVREPIHYFELFWTTEVWTTLVENTNAYAEYKEARNSHHATEQKMRWWKPITLYEMGIFIALIIYIGIVCTSNIKSFWINGIKGQKITAHKPMEFMTFYQFQQIKRYFHVLAPPTTSEEADLWASKEVRKIV